MHTGGSGYRHTQMQGSGQQQPRLNPWSTKFEVQARKIMQICLYIMEVKGTQSKQYDTKYTTVMQSELADVRAEHSYRLHSEAMAVLSHILWCL